MKLYSGNYFDSFSAVHRNEIKNEVDSESNNYILNVNIDDYAAHLFQKFRLDIPEFYFDNVTVDTEKKNILGRDFPSVFGIRDENRSFKKQVIVYHIPFTGDISLLQLRPSSFYPVSYNVTIDDSHQNVIIEIVNFYDDINKIKNLYDQHIANLTGNYNNLKNDFNFFNSDLENWIRYMVVF